MANELGRIASDRAGHEPSQSALSRPIGDHPLRKVVINACHGGFGLSRAGVECYAKHKGLTIYPEAREGMFAALSEPTYWLVPPAERLHKLAELYPRDIDRDDPALVATVEELGDAANGRCAALRVVEIPDDADWEISEYDGSEWVAEKHRTWS